MLILGFNYGILSIIMIKQEIYKYAYHVFNYWQMEYDHHIGDDFEDLINNHVLKMIVNDCYKLKLKPCNCCVVINNTFFSLKETED